MDKAQISEKLEVFIREKFEIDAQDTEFTHDVHLFDYGYIDSFGAVELTSFTESTFDITVSTSDLVVYPLNTIDEISTFIARRKAGEI